MTATTDRLSAGFINPLLIDDAVRRALDEDLGRAGDITTLATIPAGATAEAVIATRKPGVVAGLPVAATSFRILDAAVRFEAAVQDGAALAPGDVVARISGPARSVLSAERVALNFLGRMSGIATLTAAYVAKVAHTRARIVCTRKTTPNLRAFEKYAVRCGGGANHRYGLDDAVLIKDNHIAVAGGIAPALRAAKAAVGHLVKIEIEVDTLGQLDEVIAEGADVVLLDNMGPDLLREAVRRVAGRMATEASGGVNLDTVKAIAETGVDMISVGALTHSAPVLDFGLDIAITR
jgi:nicotinate-nucleotide pyrophosphorylase (carboxylating)